MVLSKPQQKLKKGEQKRGLYIPLLLHHNLNNEVEGFTAVLCLSFASSGVPEKPEIDGLTKPALEGDQITLTCSSQGSKPAADLRWFRNEKEVKGMGLLSALFKSSESGFLLANGHRAGNLLLHFIYIVLLTKAQFAAFYGKKSILQHKGYFTLITQIPKHCDQSSRSFHPI